MHAKHRESSALFLCSRRFLPGLLLALVLGIGAHRSVEAHDAAWLKERYAASTDRLAKNPFGRPIYLESEETSNTLKGDVYSVIDHPFTKVQQALQPIGHWCDILILHLNVKGCKATPGSKLALAVGKKFDQPLEDAYKLDFNYRVGAASADYLQVLLNADAGPLGTRNYRIQLQAIPIDAGRSFLHMSYSYTYGMAARMATQAYLATVGSAKVGFSSSERRADGQPNYIGGVLGLVERNTMRYYLAIDSYLAAYSLPAAEQTEKCIHTWYEATERYATQLHEMEQREYIEMKRKEIKRQKGSAS